MKEKKYKVCIIGAGPAGFAAAMRCVDFGADVCLVENRDIGGAGVHNGALSSKTLWELSKDYVNAKRRDRGYRSENIHLDYAQVVSCVSNAIAEKTNQIKKQIDYLSESQNGSIELISGLASFVDANTIELTDCKSGTPKTISAENFIIATGSRPRTLPNILVDGKKIMTSDHLMSLKNFPASLVILGAGVVGCEFATIFANYGQTKIYVIDRADRILPFEDEDIARLCAKKLEKKGVTIHHDSQLESMKVDDGKVVYTIEHKEGGKETISVDHALISIGRVPNTEHLKLEKAGITLSDRGYIPSEDTQTEVSNIYAVGDVTYDIAMVNIAEIEGRFAAEKIFSPSKKKLSYENISSIMFLDPVVASIGLNELQAQQQKIPYTVATYSLKFVNRAIAMRATDGFVKLLVSADENRKILGMRALGVHASTMIEAVSLLIKQGRSAKELAELVHPHPAVTEGLQECVRMILGTSIYKPSVFPADLRLSTITYD